MYLLLLYGDLYGWNGTFTFLAITPVLVIGQRSNFCDQKCALSEPFRRSPENFMKIVSVKKVVVWHNFCHFVLYIYRIYFHFTLFILKILEFIQLVFLSTQAIGRRNKQRYSLEKKSTLVKSNYMLNFIHSKFCLWGLQLLNVVGTNKFSHFSHFWHMQIYFYLLIHWFHSPEMFSLLDFLLVCIDKTLFFLYT